MASKDHTLVDELPAWNRVDDSLMNAVAKKDLSKTKSLIKKKVNPTKISPFLGVAAIHAAASLPEADILKALMSFPSIDINKPDSRKRTALHHAVIEGRDECAKYLIMNNADTSLVENEGLTALHLACALGHLGCVRLLIAAVHSLECKDERRRTPLFHAAARGSASVCRLLLDHGADINARDFDGRTPIMMAAENGRQAAFLYLLTKRANITIPDRKGRDVRWYASSHASLLLLMDNATHPIINSQSSEDEFQRQTFVSEPNLSRQWRPEVDLSRADLDRMPRARSQSLSRTESDRSKDLIARTHRAARGFGSEDTLNQGGNDPEAIADLKRERLDLVSKVSELTKETEELAKARNEAKKSFENYLSSQKQILDTVDIPTTTEVQNPLQKLRLIVQSYHLHVKNGSEDGTNELRTEFERKERVIEDFGKEIERLKEVIRQQEEQIEAQREKATRHKNVLRKCKERIKEQNTRLKSFQEVRTAVLHVTELNDVSDSQVADVIREIAMEYHKLQTKNNELESALNVRLTSSELFRSATLRETPLEGMSSGNEEDWKNKTTMELGTLKGSSDTPLSDVLKDQIVILKRSITERRNSVIPNLSRSNLKQFDKEMITKIEREDREISAGIKQELLLTKSDVSDFAQSESRTSGDGGTASLASTMVVKTVDQNLSDDERSRYELEIKQLRKKISLLDLENSRKVKTDSESDEESRKETDREKRLVSEALGKLVSENKRLKSELELLQKSIQQETARKIRTSDNLKLNSRAIQTDTQTYTQTEKQTEKKTEKSCDDVENVFMKEFESVRARTASVQLELRNASRNTGKVSETDTLHTVPNVETGTLQTIPSVDTKIPQKVQNVESIENQHSKELILSNPIPPQTQPVRSNFQPLQTEKPNASDTKNRRPAWLKSAKKMPGLNSGNLPVKSELNLAKKNSIPEDTAEIQMTVELSNKMEDRHGLSHQKEVSLQSTQPTSTSFLVKDGRIEEGPSDDHSRDNVFISTDVDLRVKGQTVSSHSDGTFQVPHGTISHSDGTFQVPHGTISQSDGTFQVPHGTISQSDGTFQVPHGTISHTDGTFQVPHGTISHSDGTFQVPHGTISRSDGTFQVPHETISHSLPPTPLQTGHTRRSRNSLRRSTRKISMSDDNPNKNALEPTPPKSSSSDEEFFEKMFEKNKDLLEHPIQESELSVTRKNSESKTKRLSSESKSPIRLASNRLLSTENDEILLENEKLKKEILSLRNELNEHKFVHESVNETRRQSSKSFRDESEDRKSFDGFRFLSEDENGTLKFKEFPVGSGNGNTRVSRTPSSSSNDASADEVWEKEGKGSRSHRSPRSKTHKGRPKENQRRIEGRENRRNERDLNLDESRRTRQESNSVSSYDGSSDTEEQQLQQQYLQLQQQQLNSSSRFASSLTHTTSISEEVQVIALQKQIQDSEILYNSIISTYRSHLLASIQGCLDSEVADALCRIVTLQNGRVI